MILDIRKDKMLFVFKRYKHDNNKVSILKNLSFLSITLFIVIIRSFKFIVKNESNEDDFDVNSSKDIKKNQHRPLKHSRKR